MWREVELVSEQDNRFYLWEDFMKLGESLKDELILEKIPNQKPGQCACLIYTSGTTGMPKGCMLSHDNLVWESYPLLAEVVKSNPTALVFTNRVVSYLPLSHVAGLSVDVLGHIYGGHELYFA